MAIQKWSKAKQDAYYGRSKLVTAPGAIDRTIYYHKLAVDGTDPQTLGPPLFEGQMIKLEQITGANTPATVLTVTGVAVAGQDVWSGFDRTTAQLIAAPRVLVLEATKNTAGTALVWSLNTHTGLTVA
jgi:hypothetical protein